jgi:hypothetical protein
MVDVRDDREVPDVCLIHLVDGANCWGSWPQQAAISLLDVSKALPKNANRKLYLPLATIAASAARLPLL